VQYFDPRHWVSEVYVNNKPAFSYKVNRAQVASKSGGVKKVEEPEVVEEPVTKAEQGVISEVDVEHRMVFGWFYISKNPDGSVIIDKQGDFIDDDSELEKMAYDFVVDARSGDVMHNQRKVATLIESMVFTEEKLTKMGLSSGSMPTGWWGGFKVEDDATWELVKEGKLRAFSIGGQGVREKAD
jgi:Putative phage serine protease XkdF